MKRQYQNLCLSALVLMLAACVSVLPEPDTPDALYRIDAQAEGAILARDILITEPEALNIFAGQSLVSEDSEGGLRLIPKIEWAGPATRLIQLALVDSFSYSSAGSALLPESGVRADYELSSRIQTLALVGDQAVCLVAANLIETERRRLKAQKQIEVRLSISDLTTETRAQALKSAAEQCVVNISEFVSDQLAELDNVMQAEAEQ